MMIPKKIKPNTQFLNVQYIFKTYFLHWAWSPRVAKDHVELFSEKCWAWCSKKGTPTFCSSEEPKFFVSLQVMCLEEGGDPHNLEMSWVQANLQTLPKKSWERGKAQHEKFYLSPTSSHVLQRTYKLPTQEFEAKMKRAICILEGSPKWL